VPSRWLTLGIRNEGLGIAKFPGLRFSQYFGIHPYKFGIDGNGSVGLNLRPSGPDWYFFRGGADDVIYPGELILITRMYRLGLEDGVHVPAFGLPKKRWKFQAIEFQCDLFAEGMSPSKHTKTFSEDLQNS
jgi:hypothetical protein